ncbi:MAG: lipopolysaccharide biosynthesis protein [Dermatophilaceae bacterium]
MNRRRDFYAISGNVAYAVGQMAMLLAFSRLGTLAELGLYTFALAVTAPIQLGFGMRLRSVRVVSADRAGPLSVYVIASGVTSLVAIGVSGALGAFLMDTTTDRLLFVVLACAKAFDSMIDLTYGELQRLDRFDSVAVSQVLRSVLLVGPTVAALYYGQGAIGVAIATGLTSLAVLVLWQAPLVRRVAREHRDSTPERPTVSGVLELTRQAWPLGLSGGITSLTGTLPRIVAFGTLGATAGGVLAMLTYPASVLTLLGNSLGQSVLGPMRAAREASDLDLLRRIAGRQKRLLWAVGTTGMLLLGVAGDAILAVALPSVEEDLTMTALLYLLAACVAAAASISYYELTSTGSFTSHPALSLGVLCLAAPALLAGASVAGLNGIAVAMVFYFGVQYVAWTAISRRSLLSNSASRPEEGTT